MGMYDVTFWNGSYLIATAERVVAKDKRKAAKAGLRCIDHRKRTPHNIHQLLALRKHLEYPSLHPAPDGIRIFVAEVDRGERVVG